MTEQRTIQQNKAMHKFFEQLAEVLNDAGFDMKKVMKPEVDIYWTAENIKEFLWKPIQEALFIKQSTTELNTDQVSRVHETLMRHLCEKLKIDYVQFPSWRNPNG